MDCELANGVRAKQEQLRNEVLGFVFRSFPLRGFLPKREVPLAKTADNRYYVEERFVVRTPKATPMHKFDTFMTGFAMVFTGIAGSLVMFGEAIGQSFANSSSTSPSGEPPQRTEIDYFDGFKKDREALAFDWGKIGGDFRRAIDQYVETHEGKTNPVI